MSLNTLAPDPWADAAHDGAVPQHHRNPGPAQPHQQQTPQQQPPPSDTSSISSSSPPASASHDDQLDRQMLRHLMKKYTAEGLTRLMQEETSSPILAGHDGASILTNSTYSSVKSEDSSSIFDSASSTRAFSDTSSTRGSIISNVSARTAKFLSRKHNGSSTSLPQPLPHSPTQLSNLSASTSHVDSIDGGATRSSEAGVAATNGGAKQRGTFMCGFCKEEGVQKTCTRKNDLKRHIEDFHNTNAQWFCRHRGCNMVFDWQTVYKTHLKQAHGGSRTNLDDCKVTLCPQTVFACGFETCTEVFEAASDGDADGTFKEYVAHVVKHLDDGATSGEWTYSTRMRNLLRQTGVIETWVRSAWPEEERNKLFWEPQTSGVLRKRLETRHLGDLNLLVQYAIALGTDPASEREYQDTFPTLTKDECRMHIPGHTSRPRSSQSTMSDPDQFQFRISRGAPPNPQLANYYASQRRAFSTRAPVRSGRSARPPVHTLPSSSQQAFRGHQNAAIFDPNTYYNSQAHQQAIQQRQQQQFSMMPPPQDNGIIADDLRSLHSMASSTSSTDIDMADASILMSQQPEYPDPYVPSEMSNHAPPDGCGPGGMKFDQRNQYGDYDVRNGY
uniref:C2H2-type domain-containing protein n=1 Tax=Bionectria ochroleuca TaxID=29856 RepID=A0A0B7K9K7_BIOOC